MKKTVVIFAYGFMGLSSIKSFLKNKNFIIKGVILPQKNKFYKFDRKIVKLKKNFVMLYSDNQKEIKDYLKKINPDCVIISTFNRVIDSQTLKYSKFINVHHGKLPAQKGRASINWAFIMGRNFIYVSIHEAVPELDAGKLIVQKKFSIKKKDNYFSIKEKINYFLQENLSNIVWKYLQGKIKLKFNDKKKSTWNCSRNPEDSMINFFLKSKDVLNLIRGCSDNKFGAYCFLKSKKIIILDAKINFKKKYEGIIPGRIVKLYKNGEVGVLCADKELIIKKIYFSNKICKPNKIIKSTRETLLND